jgi:hypothetical protein
MEVQEPTRGEILRFVDTKDLDKERIEFYIPSIQARRHIISPVRRSLVIDQLQDNLFNGRRSHQMEGIVVRWTDGL